MAITEEAFLGKANSESQIECIYQKVNLIT